MGATKIEFRLRMAILVIIVTLGFSAPWIDLWNIGERIPLLEWLALLLSRTGLVSFTAAAALVIVAGALFAGAGAALRVWGTAYLGPFTMRHGEMQAGAVMADGPYQFVRNPLYLGSWCMFAAMSLIMPASGAVFAMILVSIFQLRLILGEEAFLRGQIGEPYLAYLRAVPRLIPSLQARLKPAGVQPLWLNAVLAELNPIGVFLIISILSWRYDNWLMVRAIIVVFGISLVAGALMPRAKQQSGS